MKKLGYIKVGAAVHRLEIANPQKNLEEIKRIIEQSKRQKVEVLVFPELNITAYTCGDLFQQDILLQSALEALQEIVQYSKHYTGLVFLGLPLIHEQRLYNCAVAIQMGEILGVVPKIYIPNDNEFYEKRWFTSGYPYLVDPTEIELFGEKYPFGGLIFREKNHQLMIGVEICEDLWAPLSPGMHLALNGANLIVNLSASNELVAKTDYRRQLVASQSAKMLSAYVYTSAGIDESTTDVVFGGESLIYENGRAISTGKRFVRDSHLTIGEIDVQYLNHQRQSNKTFADSMVNYKHQQFKIIDIKPLEGVSQYDELVRQYDKNPFVPKYGIDRRCEEIFEIQASALAKRLEHIGCDKVVLGISGGLDSTLALLVVIETYRKLGKPLENIIGVTMPGFGTTDRTYENAIQLMKGFGIDVREISIKPAVLQHFKDLGHDENCHDLTYENSQARERTQLLMDLATKEKGIVIGTGDLSEVALGWSTYNGDHMSMYAVNVSVPKTLIQFIIQWVLENKLEEETEKTLLENVLRGILDTPISPELLPPDAQGEIKQKTEDVVGPYILHDFCLYHMIKSGMTPSKIQWVALQLFQDEFDEATIRKWIKVFFSRFFSQQFKRSCIPDGPKVGSVSLSPRGDWRMPTDGISRAWLRDLEE